MPLLLADFIYSRDCKLNLRKTIDTTAETIQTNHVQLAAESNGGLAAAGV